MRTFILVTFLLLPLQIWTPRATEAADRTSDVQHAVATADEERGGAPILLASRGRGGGHGGGHGRFHRGNRHVDHFFSHRGHGHGFKTHDRHFRSHFRHDRGHLFRDFRHDRHHFRHGGRSHFDGRHFGVSLCVRTGSALVCFNDGHRGRRY